MTREWKPGDPEVAIISWQSQSGRSGGTSLALRCSRAYDESHWRTTTFGEIPDYKVIDYRPLLVIDPEDREQVERLWALYFHGDADPQTALQDALRAMVGPPKPDKPKAGLGAVVRDREGALWVRVSPARFRQCSGAHRGRFREWDEIDAVEVLADGTGVVA